MPEQTKPQPIAGPDEPTHTTDDERDEAPAFDDPRRMPKKAEENPS